MKKIFFILLGLLLVICVIDAAVDFFYFAGPGKEKAIKLLSQHLGTKVSLEKLKFRLVSGFSARNLVIYDAANEKPLLTVEKVKVEPSYLSLFTKTKVIELLELQEPKLYATRTKWNLLKNKSFESPILIKKIKIKRGQLEVEPYQWQLSQLNLKVKLKPSGLIKGSFSGSLQNSLIQLKGSYNLFSGELNTQGKTIDFPLQAIKPFLDKPVPDLKGLSGKVNAEFTLKGTTKKELFFQTKLQGSEIIMAFTPWQGQGDLKIQANGNVNIPQNKWSYKGEADLSNTQINTSLLPSPIQKLSGKFLFENNFLTTSGMEGSLEGKSIRLRGSIENLQDPRFHASLFTDLEPEKIYDIAKIVKPTLFQKSSLKGKSFTQIDFRTDDATGKIVWNGKIYLKEANFKMEDFPLQYNNLKGSITFSEKSAQLKDLEGELVLGENFKTLFQTNIVITPTKIEMTQFSGKTPSLTFKGNGSIDKTNTPTPEISFYLTSKEYSLLLQGNLQERILKIQKLSGYGLGTTFDIFGDLPLSLNKKATLKGKTKINTVALQKAWPSLWEKVKWLRTWSPEGSFEIAGFVKGMPANKESWESELSIKGKRILLRNFDFDEFQMKTYLKNQKIRYEEIRGQIGEGTLTGQLAFDFSNKPTQYWIQLKAENIELQKLPKFLGNSELRYQGNLNGKLQMRGLSKRPQSASGSASIEVSDGRLWETPLLKPIWVAIKNLAPRLNKPAFRSVKGNFQINEGKFQTENFELKGPGLILKAKGTIGLDQKVNMLFTTQFLEPEGSKIKILAAKGLNLFGKLLEIQYRGTLTEPVVNRRWLPLLDKFVSGR